MSASLRKKLVFLTLPLALLYALYNWQTNEPAAPTVNNQPAAVASLAAAIPSPAVNATVHNRPARLAAPWGRDPFRYGSRPLPQRTERRLKAGDAPTAPKSAGWIVSGILYNDTNPIAYINGKAVTVGQTIDNARVIAITKSSVTLEAAGKQLTVTPR